MPDIFDDIFALNPIEELAFKEIMREVDAKAKSWTDDIKKFDVSLEVSSLVHELDHSLRMTKNPATAAYNAFRLAALISQVEGPKELDDIAQRYDAMSLEIDEVLNRLKQYGLKPKALLVWKELVKHCGQPGSCCLSIENDPISDEQKIVWGRPGGAVQRMKYSSLQGRLVRKNRR